MCWRYCFFSFSNCINSFHHYEMYYSYLQGTSFTKVHALWKQVINIFVIFINLKWLRLVPLSGHLCIGKMHILQMGCTEIPSRFSCQKLYPGAKFSYKFESTLKWNYFLFTFQIIHLHIYSFLFLFWILDLTWLILPVAMEFVDTLTWISYQIIIIIIFGTDPCFST